MTQHRQIFQNEARTINNLFRFAVCGVERPGHWVQNDGPNTVVLQGRTYHCIFQLDRPGHYLNWILFDQIAYQRAARVREIPVDIADVINQALLAENPFIRILNMWNANHADQVHLELASAPGSGEVAAVWYGGDGENNPRSIYIRRRGDGEPSYVNAMSSLLEPLSYPLLFPKGEPGWFPGRRFLSGLR